MNSRRYFLARSLSMLIRPKEADPAITYFGPDAFLVEHRGLHCGVGRQADGSWQLAFSIFRTTKTWGGETEERVKPSPTLQAKLRELGIVTENDGLSLVGRSEVPVDAEELLRKMMLVPRR
jgi:hypothetical protein